MEFESLDIIIVGLILFLSLKGIVSGFTKELFNFIGLVGGIALASRVNIEVGEFLSKNVFPLDNEPSLKLVGFVATLLAVWLVFTVISSMFESASDEIGFLSRILGYLFTIARYIAIFAIIVVGIGQSDYLSEKLSKHYEKSQLFPILNSIGTELLNNQIENNQTTANTDDINLSNFKIDNNNSNNIKE